MCYAWFREECLEYSACVHGCFSVLLISQQSLTLLDCSFVSPPSSSGFNMAFSSVCMSEGLFSLLTRTDVTALGANPNPELPHPVSAKTEFPNKF